MRLNKSAILLSATLATLALTSVPASAAVAPDSDDLAIVEVGTDAMGADVFSNRNREFVKFKNVSDHPVDIAGVLVEDNWAHARTVAKDKHTCNTYEIKSLPGGAMMLGKGEYVTIFNGVRWGGNRKLDNGSVVEYQLFANSDRDCGTSGHFLNNNNDSVYVSEGDGDVLATYSWDHNGGYTFKPQP